MTEISLAWLLKQGVAAQIVGAIKTPIRAIDFYLNDENAAYFESEYTPHRIVGASPQMM